MVMRLMIVSRDGFLGFTFHVASLVDHLFTLVSPAVLARRMRHEWRLTGGTNTDILRLHGIMSSTSANAGS